ncbi:MAG: divalent metal cation transporter [Acidobacteriota bacterium]|nr:divalent metal cation transporter [Acidobacteriota bacterium]
MKRLLSVLFWSVISAAFIGPGTVTTCAAAGASHGLALLWALTFSTVACLTLQEAAARITVVSGRDLGQALRSHAGSFAVPVVALGVIVLGCAAYEAGNILGAVAGASLSLEIPRGALTVITAVTAGALLWFAAVKTVARLLGVLVAVMGIAFVVTAVAVAPAAKDLVRGLVVPSFPGESGLLVVGLIGTTVVPYNLFLGSGLARGQRLGEVRFGLAVAIGLGGLISMGVLVVGTSVTGPFGFAALADALAARLGGWAAGLFALGLFAAGLSSAMTAPLAAAVTARSVFGTQDQGRWDERSGRYRAVWAVVLASGVVFGLTEIQPVPAILLAQVLNGILLPFVAVFLFVLVNDRRLMGDDGINGLMANALTALTVGVTVMLGTTAVLRAGSTAAGGSAPDPGIVLAVSGVVTAAIGVWLYVRIRRARSPRSEVS